jgi:hypothetical protein
MVFSIVPMQNDDVLYCNLVTGFPIASTRVRWAHFGLYRWTNQSRIFAPDNPFFRSLLEKKRKIPAFTQQADGGRPLTGDLASGVPHD